MTVKRPFPNLCCAEGKISTFFSKFSQPVVSNFYYDIKDLPQDGEYSYGLYSLICLGSGYPFL